MRQEDDRPIGRTTFLRRLTRFSRSSVVTARPFAQLLPQTTPARRPGRLFRRACKVGRERRYTRERREPLGAFGWAKPRLASTPADFRKAMGSDADFT